MLQLVPGHTMGPFREPLSAALNRCRGHSSSELLEQSSFRLWAAVVGPQNACGRFQLQPFGTLGRLSFAHELAWASFLLEVSLGLLPAGLPFAFPDLFHRDAIQLVLAFLNFSCEKRLPLVRSRYGDPIK